jgi:hypothetical protein
VHDKIGQVAKWVVKLQERFGNIRASTAFEFYLAVKKFLVLNKKYDSFDAKFRKGQFEATRYELYYAASSSDDARDKPAADVHIVLDRSAMWDATSAKTSSLCHEFVGFGGGADNLGLRALPCPCEHCCTPGANMNNYSSCTNQNIEGIFTTLQMLEKERVDIPQVLQEPIEQYSVALLKEFIKRMLNNPPKVINRKQEYVDVIRAHLSEFILPLL